jgi:hypothetical protein
LDGAGGPQRLCGLDAVAQTLDAPTQAMPCLVVQLLEAVGQARQAAIESVQRSGQPGGQAPGARQGFVGAVA